MLTKKIKLTKEKVNSNLFIIGNAVGYNIISFFPQNEELQNLFFIPKRFISKYESTRKFTSLNFFVEFLHIKYLNLEHFNGTDISPLKNIKSIVFLNLGKYNGKLDDLKNIKIKVLQLKHFNGDLSPLKNCDIEDLDITWYSGDLNTFQNSKTLKVLDTTSQDIKSISNCPLEYLSLHSEISDYQFKYLLKMPLKHLYLEKNYNYPEFFRDKYLFVFRFGSERIYNFRKNKIKNTSL